MNLTDETLRPHGGFKKNNLNDIFHLEDEYINEEDFQIETSFKLSPYFDETNIGEYCNLHKESLNVMSFNAESIFNKIEYIRILIKSLQKYHNYQLHVISIQEAWLTEGRPLSEIQIEDYKLLHEYNKIGGQKGGIVVYVHNTYKASEHEFLESPSQSWEGLTLDISGDLLHKPLRLHTIYRPTRQSLEDCFMNEFEHYL